MEKIPTLFERDRGGKVFDQLSNRVLQPSNNWVASEKLDGANVRVTVRNGEMVRLEVRRNPSKKQKETGIIDPWYRDAHDRNSKTSDYWLWDAAINTNYAGVPDGEWSAEAIGPKIQGNPYNLEEHTLFFFSLVGWEGMLASSVNIPHVYNRAPFEFEALRDWLGSLKSSVNSEMQVEGVVWWVMDMPVAKIKLKDFRRGED